MRPNMQPTQDANMGKALSRLSQYMHKTLGVMIFALVLAALRVIISCCSGQGSENAWNGAVQRD